MRFFRLIFSDPALLRCIHGTASTWSWMKWTITVMWSIFLNIHKTRIPQNGTSSKRTLNLWDWIKSMGLYLLRFARLQRANEYNCDGRIRVVCFKAREWGKIWRRSPRFSTQDLGVFEKNLRLDLLCYFIASIMAWYLFTLSVAFNSQWKAL